MILQFFFLAVFLGSSQAYSSGAPEGQCNQMKPNKWIHFRMVDRDPSDPKTHYAIVVNGSTYSPGESVSVTIEAFTDEYRFKGFFLQARKEGEPLENGPIGTFLSDSLPAQTKIIKCPNNGEGVTHAPAGLHRSLTFTWIPPEDANFTVVFYATIVKSLTQYWVRHTSEPITFKEVEEEVVEENTDEETEKENMEGVVGETKVIKTPSKPRPNTGIEDKSTDKVKEETSPSEERETKGKKGKRGGKKRKGERKREGGRRKEGGKKKGRRGKGGKKDKRGKTKEENKPKERGH